MLWVALAIGALLACKCLSFISTLADTAAKMAGSAPEPNSYRAVMTPSWLMSLMGICFIELVGAADMCRPCDQQRRLEKIGSESCISVYWRIRRRRKGRNFSAKNGMNTKS